MKTKRFMPTKAMQMAVLDVLQDLEDILMTADKTANVEAISSIFAKHKAKYMLQEDAFTNTICLPEQAVKSELEHRKQSMIEKYGHYDGI